MSAVITPIVPEYINQSFKLRPTTRLYQKLLDKPNITYMIGVIVKPKFEELAFFILKSNRVYSIPKIMGFVNNINNAQCIIAYFCTKVLTRL